MDPQQPQLTYARLAEMCRVVRELNGMQGLQDGRALGSVMVAAAAAALVNAVVPEELRVAGVLAMDARIRALAGGAAAGAASAPRPGPGAA